MTSICRTLGCEIDTLLPLASRLEDPVSNSLRDERFTVGAILSGSGSTCLGGVDSGDPSLRLTRPPILFDDILGSPDGEAKAALAASLALVPGGLRFGSIDTLFEFCDNEPFPFKELSMFFIPRGMLNRRRS